EVRAELPDLVLEELSHRLDQLESELLRQAPDIVMSLDDGRRTLDRDRLDDVGIERALREILRARNGPRLAFKDLDERAAADPPFLFGVDDPFQPLEEQLRSVDGMDGDSQMSERLDHAPALLRPHQAVVDENRANAVAQSLSQENRRYRRIDSP